MASRIRECFETLKKNNKKALVPYFTVGDPSLKMALPTLDAFVENGADLIEIGIPFTDPTAEGPVIQRAHESAIAQGVTLKHVLGVVKKFRVKNKKTPVVLMGYLNPIEIMGYDLFADACCDAGVDGVLIVDMPVDEGAHLKEKLKNRGVDCIYLLAPTSSLDRIKKICQDGSGYLYYVSIKGVTGTSGKLDVSSIEEKLAVIRDYTTLPIGVGFGIRDGASAAAVANVADAAIVGSALVKLLSHSENHDEGLKAASALLSDMRSAIDDFVLS